MTVRRIALLVVVVAVTASGCSTAKQVLGVPNAGDPSVAIKSAETKWLLIKNPRFGDVPSEPEYVWVEEGKTPITFGTVVFGKGSIIAPPEIVYRYGSPPGGGKISARQNMPTQAAPGTPAPTQTAATPAPKGAAPAAPTPAPTPTNGKAPEGPKRGVVVYVDTTRIVIDLTAADGIRAGTLVSLRRDAIPLVHPVTGEVLGELDEEVGTARVTEMRDRFSVADVQTVAPARGSRSRIASSRSNRSWPRPLSSGSSRRASPGLIGADLESVEAEIRRELDSPVALIQEMGGYIAGAGGKRLRPMLLLLAARLAGYVGPRSVRLACVVEMLHTATLIHDDVVDQAPLRRGRPSANAQWGDDASVLVGDHLYSKSFAMLVRDNDRAVMETLARSTVSMTEAEVFQLELKRSGVTTEADYLRIITQKTASFMSACCRIGALLGGLPAAQVDALTQYGLDIGVAFQISDDSLDFVANQDRLGKAIGADLREGKRTLPLIAMLARATRAESERVKSLLKRRDLDAEEIDEIRRYVLDHEGVEYALAQAHQYARSAKAALAAFTPSEERETLALIADFVVDRDR